MEARQALHERKTFLHIAPHLSHSLPIMLPVYTWWKLPYFWAGTKMYDILAGKENMESSYIMVSFLRTLKTVSYIHTYQNFAVQRQSSGAISYAQI